MEEELSLELNAELSGLAAQADMLVEPSLEAMPQVLAYLQGQCARYALGTKQIRRVSSAGAQAFCAACLAAHKGLISLDLTLVRTVLELRVGFSGKCKARPYGLAPALFNPLGCRTLLEQSGYNWTWTASWEL